MRLLRFLPTPFWCYMLPMLAGSLGWIPKQSPLYSFVSQQILPVCLVLLLIGTDLKSLARLGPAAIRIMLAGAAGTILGGIGSFFLYKQWLPPGSWGAVGALTGSWIGGSANLLAVKEALGVPDSLIGPVILVDALVAYSWMALLVAASGWQEKWDRLIGLPKPLGMEPGFTGRLGRPTVPAGLSLDLARPGQETIPGHRGRSVCAKPVHPGPIPRVFQILTLAIFVSLSAQAIAKQLPTLPGFNAAAWTILLVTTVTLILSTTPLRRLGEGNSARMGTWLLYLLLITIGARADLRAVASAPAFLALGATWILIHGIVLLAAGYFWRTPLSLIATASQANIGGVVSAPIVGATYAPELAGAGLLMAILGNILGTYLGLLTAGLLKALL